MYGIEALLAGRTLAGRYRIDEVIGRGGMGAVYRATDERLARPVAVKVISAGINDEDAHTRLRARFHREARAAARLHHPNIVTVYDYGTDPALELDFIVMELLEGEDLASRLRRAGAPSLPLAKRILTQAARGVGAGHRAGLIHRDVKPGNLFLEQCEGEIEVRVLDFGIAELTSDEATITHLTMAGSSPFSPAYASPEQMRGERGLTPASDVFSLGAVGFHLALGERAFSAGDSARMSVELTAAHARLRDSALPGALATVLARALAHEPADRFGDADAMARALQSGGAPHVAASATNGAAPQRSRWHTRTSSGNDTAGTRYQPRREAPRPDPVAPPSLNPPPARSADRVPPAATEAPAPERLPGLFERLTTAFMNFLITCLVIALYGGAWFITVATWLNGGGDEFYAGIAAAVVLAPLMLHRLTGRRGSFRLAFIASIAATIGAVFTVGQGGDTAVLLAALVAFQLIASFVMLRLTRRRTPRRPPADAHGSAVRQPND